MIYFMACKKNRPVVFARRTCRAEQRRGKVRGGVETEGGAGRGFSLAWCEIRAGAIQEEAHQPGVRHVDHAIRAAEVAHLRNKTKHSRSKTKTKPEFQSEKRGGVRFCVVFCSSICHVAVAHLLRDVQCERKVLVKVLIVDVVDVAREAHVKVVRKDHVD